MKQQSIRAWMRWSVLYGSVVGEIKAPMSRKVEDQAMIQQASMGMALGLALLVRDEQY